MYTLNYIMDGEGRRKGFFEWVFTLNMQMVFILHGSEKRERERERESDQTAEIIHRL
jgi:hypothetical protein